MIRKIFLTGVLSLLPLVCAAENARAPTEALAARVKAYQNASDCAGMIGLFYTEGMDKDRRAAFEKTVKEYVCGNFNRKITSVAFQAVSADAVPPPPDFKGTHSVYTLSPSGTIVIDYGMGSPNALRALTFLYGAHDGKLYLITSKGADAK